VNIDITIFLDVTPCSLIPKYYLHCLKERMKYGIAGVQAKNSTLAPVDCTLQAALLDFAYSV
jgi:hypothetical protein